MNKSGLTEIEYNGLKFACRTANGGFTFVHLINKSPQPTIRIPCTMVQYFFSYFKSCPWHTPIEKIILN